MLGAFLLGLTMIAVGYPLWWNYHDNLVGLRLLHRSQAEGTYPKTKDSTFGTGCNNDSTTPTRQRPGILSIPAIGLSAPVIAGVSNAVLRVAVGHDPVTVWPGEPGESVLLAHDVSYFSHLDRLRVGDVVSWTLGCQRSVFRVISTTVTHPGSPIGVPSSGSGLALVTCWPTNALFWTPARYVVETKLVARMNLKHVSSALPPKLARLKVPAPAALRAEGLSLAQSGIFVGHLSMAGKPSQNFKQGPQPLLVTAAALRDYAAAAKTASVGNKVWWSSIARPGVPLPAAWALSFVTNVTLIVSGNSVKGAVIASSAATVKLVVYNGVLFVSDVTIRIKASRPE